MEETRTVYRQTLSKPPCPPPPSFSSSLKILYSPHPPAPTKHKIDTPARHDGCSAHEQQQQHPHDSNRVPRVPSRKPPPAFAADELPQLDGPGTQHRRLPRAARPPCLLFLDAAHDVKRTVMTTMQVPVKTSWVV